MKTKTSKRRRKSGNANFKLASFFRGVNSDSRMSADVHMFVQDVPSIMPYIGFSGARKFTVLLDGDKGESQRATALLESLVKYPKSSLEELTADAIRQIAEHLAWHGESIYEIARDIEDPTIQVLRYVTPRRLYKIFGYYIQIPPKPDRNRNGDRFVAVEQRRIWRILMPPKLGGRGQYGSILRKLKKIEHLGPAFWREDIEQQANPPYFEFMTYVREVEIYYERITKRWGWTRRDLTLRNRTEFASCYRLLTFRWAQSVLREYLIDEVNALFARQRIGVKLSVVGLPYASDILGVRDEMSAGVKSFDDALEATAF
jgi:hypothetical protein